MQLTEEYGSWSGFGASNASNGKPEGLLLVCGEEVRFTYKQAADLRDWSGLMLELWVPEGKVVELTLRVYPLTIGRPDYVPYTSANIAVCGNGWTCVSVGWEAFSFLKVTGALWRLVEHLGLRATVRGSSRAEELPIRGIRLHKGAMSLSASRKSYAAEPGQTVVYAVDARNETGETQAIALRLDYYGFESMEASVAPSVVRLEPGQTEQVYVTVQLHSGVAPGGYEKLALMALPNGDTRQSARLTLYTVRKLPHPYIIHTDEGWEEVKRNIGHYDWAREKLQQYIRRAEAWAVPETNGAGASYAYELAERFNLHAAGVAWKLTGRQSFLDKAMLFLRRFVDPVSGYPATEHPVFHIYSSHEELELPTPRAVKVCSGGLIHEGEFMVDIASIYDLLYDAPGWSDQDRKRVEAAFRLFIEKVDWMITDGDMNNIPSGGMIGALLCSLVIQDMHWIRRFIDGPGGFIDMVATGVMDDGWYFEGATNYVLLFADMLTRGIQACEPWGFHLKELYVPPSHKRNAMQSPWSMPREKPFLGMSFEKWGPVHRNYRSVKDIWDGMLPFVDHRGILFGTNDSTDKDMVHPYDLAYYLWRDPRYVSVLRETGRRNLIYGVGELPEPPAHHAEASAYADNVGLAVLRSRKEGASPEARIQAVVKYGSHGGYHGHYDRTGLVSLMRYGKNAYGPLASWYGYASFMFKMWVQASVSHNMVVVDQRMQEPAESKRLLFHSGVMLNACAVETTARWCDPPYGGQTPYPETFPEERSWIEGRDMPLPAVPREQGDIGEYSEPILQRRLVAVTDDYVVIADYVRGEQEHIYDCLHHYQGFQGLEAQGLKLVRHTGQMNEDPYGAGQFITDCDWYACTAPALARFSHEYDPAADDSEGRHMLHNEPGRIDLHLRSLWPPEQEIMTGWYAEASPVNKRLSYEVLADGKVLAEGWFGAWMLGKRSVRAELHGAKTLTLRVRVQKATRKTVFWGDPYLILEDGRRIHLSELDAERRNVDSGHGVGRDYYGGPVHLQGEPYPDALPFEPLDAALPAEAVYDLSGLEAEAFEAVIGGDYPLGVDPARRKTVSIRAEGKAAVFLSVLEPHVEASVIASAEAISAQQLIVRLKDGRRHELQLEGLTGDEDGIRLRLSEWREDQLLREETAVSSE